MFPVHLLSLSMTLHGNNPCRDMSLSMEVNGLFSLTSLGDGPVDVALSHI